MQIDIEPKQKLDFKGSLSGAQVVGKNVELWYSSPTGDSTDSFIHILPCLNEAQAQSIAHFHRVIWGLEIPD